MKAWMFAVCLAVSPTASTAGYYETGNDIHEACQQSLYGLCLGYVAGIADAAYFSQYMCIPLEVQLNQVRDVFTDRAMLISVNPSS
jgi:hypothetical protein